MRCVSTSNRRPCPIIKDLLAWWFEHRALFLTLYRVALDCLFVLPTLVPSEKGNSVANRLFSGRARLSSTSFKSQICGNSWLKLMDQLELQVPSNPRAYLKETVKDLRAGGSVQSLYAQYIIEIATKEPDLSVKETE